VSANGSVSYTSVLIVRRGSGITLDQVLACGRRYSFGMGDAQSTSGTLAPMTYLFAPRNINPTECFSTVRSASHQANLFAVANGVIDIATNNSVGLVFAARENPQAARNVQVIWNSPPLPESAILVRRDLDPALRERIRQFFLTYGQGQGPEADRQRGILRALEYGGFQAADNSYLDPVRLMEASTALQVARHGSNQAATQRAQAAYDQVQREIAAHGTQH
jgi:phosphonate transport system substrate-binding protein